MLPRSLWWTFYVITLADFAVNILSSFFDRDHWYPNAALFSVLTIAIVSHRLAYPPVRSKDRA